MGLKAKDIMRRQVITVTPEMTLRELSALFIDREISGAPVVDAKGNLAGVVSQTDLVRRDREMRSGTEVPAYYRDSGPGYYKEPQDAGYGVGAEARSRGYEVQDPDFTRVRDVMTPAVFSADEAASVEDVARSMLRKHIHRVIITRRDKLCGIVTSMDLLRAFLGQSKERASAAKS